MAKYAQHFLINTHAVERIVNSMHLTPQNTVLEIGPGKGALTAMLLEKAGRVVTIEIDPLMVEVLQKKFSTKPNLTIINQDIRDVNFDEGLLGHKQSLVKIVGNLPYNLTSPILRKICDWDGWTEAYVMVQKEVGDRMGAQVGTPDYGALTVGINLTCKIEPVFILSETSFKPPPHVKSAVVRLIRRDKPLTPDVDKAQRVIQAAFQQRRKTILNSLSHGLNIPKEKIIELLNQLKIDVSIRAEQLTISQFIEITSLYGNLT